MSDDFPYSDVYNFMNNEFVEDDDPVVYAVAEHIGSSSSQPCQKKRTENPRQIQEGAALLQRDYFDVVPIFPEAQFRRRFRMHRSLFVRMADELIEKTPYFQQKHDAIGRPGLSPYQKITAAVRLLAYDISADLLGEYLRISAKSGLNCLKHFSRAVVRIFRGKYLRQPTAEDVRQLNEFNTRRGFPGMLGSIDCMHWKWKNCPTAWAAQYQSGHKNEPSIVLQAVASHNLWIWHAYFGASGCNNDINVLEESDLFDTLLQEKAPPCNYVINGHQYDMGYYLADGIYPPWACFVKTIPSPFTPNDCQFARCQKAARKDVERAFGVLQSRWHILRGSARLWDQTDLKYIMMSCIILHNMIVDDEFPDELLSGNFPTAESDDPPPALPVIQTSTLPVFRERNAHVSLRNKQTHMAFQQDLIEHIWQIHGSGGF